MNWSATDIPGQSGRVAVVTGANGGLGLETARELAREGAHVVMAVRNQQKAHEAVEDILTSAPKAALELVPLDLASQASVRAAAEQILREHEHVDLLVNKAGVMGIPQRKTIDCYEMQFGVDHLGHWALTALLLPALLDSSHARIVTVTSTAHNLGRSLDPENPHLEGRYRPWRAYGQAKLASFHFGLGLQRKLAHVGASAASLIAHPALSNTDLQAVSVHETGGGASQRFFLMLAPHRRVARRGRSVTAARSYGPAREGRRVLRPTVGQQRPAGAQADRSAPRNDPRDHEAMGSLRARDWHTARAAVTATAPQRARGASRARRRATPPPRVDEPIAHQAGVLDCAAWRRRGID